MINGVIIEFIYNITFWKQARVILVSSVICALILALYLKEQLLNIFLSHGANTASQHHISAAFHIFIIKLIIDSKTFANKI